MKHQRLGVCRAMTDCEAMANTALLYNNCYMSRSYPCNKLKKQDLRWGTMKNLVLLATFAVAAATDAGSGEASQVPTGCKNFAFVSILKSGGRSVTKHFGKAGTPEETFLNQLRLPCGACGNMHEVTAQNQVNDIGATSWDSAHTFAVIRNPYDWIANLYFYEKVLCFMPHNPVLQIAAQTGTESYLCNMNDTQKSRPNEIIFREWLEVADAQNNVRHTEFLLPNPAAFPIYWTSFPFGQYAWLSTATGLEISVNQLYKFEDIEAMNKISNPGLLLRELCDYVPDFYDNSATSAFEHMHPLANSTVLYDARSCEIVSRRLDADFRKFGYSKDCPSAV